MAWLRIDTRMFNHPVAFQVSPAAMWLWVRGGCWLAQYPEQGDQIPLTVAKSLGKKRLIEELVESGLWVRINNPNTGGGYEMYHRMDLAGSGLRDFSWSPPPPREGQRRKPIPQWMRDLVYERDEHSCVSCGAVENLSLDHVYPWSLGGEDEPENLQTLCRSCNSSKGARV